ncbi:TetR/AcrR family transcriptional regulator [Baekduia soli]|uniref:TetR/AcrR family transcriptional regulator n=1 Tax=Baekduia soli TaxID=496014 RepID=A0A5B8UBF0_9ACTN|nr:TetR/AcrR family transcriptional regulator [Baekduia soli]
MSLATKPSLRRDAQRNRERILDATRAAFCELGLDVGVDEIARRAGVGMGTLYRHFPTKDALIDAVVDARFTELNAAAQSALAAPDAWEGLESFLLAAVELQAADRGFKDALTTWRRDEPGVRPARRRLHAAVRKLVGRAQEAGQLRADLAAEDVLVLLWATARIVERTSGSAPGQARRFLALHLAGLRPEAARDALPEAPLTPRQLQSCTLCPPR